MNPLYYVVYRLNDLRLTNPPRFALLNAAVDIGVGLIVGAVLSKFFFC